MGLEQQHPISTNPRSSNYLLRHNAKPHCNDDWRYWMPNTAPVMSQFITVLTTEHIRTRSGNAEDKSSSALVQYVMERQQRTAQCPWALPEIFGGPPGSHCEGRNCLLSPVHQQSVFPPRTLFPKEDGTANGWQAWTSPTYRPGVMIVPTWFPVADNKWNGQAHRMHDTRSHTHLVDRQ